MAMWTTAKPLRLGCSSTISMGSIWLSGSSFFKAAAAANSSSHTYKLPLLQRYTEASHTIATRDVNPRRLWEFWPSRRYGRRYGTVKTVKTRQRERDGSKSTSSVAPSASLALPACMHGLAASISGAPPPLELLQIYFSKVDWCKIVQNEHGRR